MKQLRTTLFMLAILANAVVQSNPYWTVFFTVLVACKMWLLIDDVITEVRLAELVDESDLP